jgi:hypothetical protein
MIRPSARACLPAAPSLQERASHFAALGHDADRSDSDLAGFSNSAQKGDAAKLRKNRASRGRDAKHCNIL